MIAGTDFTGRTISGDTASDISWTTLGISTPGDMTATPVGGGTFGGLFDTPNAQGHFAPDRNTGNEGPWSTSFSFSVTSNPVQLDDMTLDWQHFNNSGNFQTVNRSVDWTVTVTRSISGIIGSQTNLNVNGQSGIEVLTFSSPLILDNTKYGPSRFLQAAQTALEIIPDSMALHLMATLFRNQAHA